MTETDRVLSLPRLSPGHERDVPEQVYEKYRRSGTSWRLRHLQALCLHEFSQTGGLFANLTVGEGKTIVTGLLPHFADLPEGRDAHLFVPASAVEKTYEELVELDKHFVVSRRLWVNSYGRLSNIHSGPDLLRELNPGMLIFDEAHMLANVESVSWLRVIHWLESMPDTKVATLTGTMMKTGLTDFSHLLAISLRGDAPVPLDWDSIQPWVKTIGEDTAMSWALKADWKAMQPLVDAFGDGTDLLTKKKDERKTLVREAFRERLDTCRGVVLSKKQSTDVPLSVEVLTIPLPASVQKALDDLDDEWVRPDGEYLSSGLEIAAVGQQLSQGFHYYWDWPDGPDDAWLDSRAAFNKAVAKIVRRKVRGKDSPGQVYRHMRRLAALLAFSQPKTPLEQAGFLSCTATETLSLDLWDAFDSWVDEREKPTPPTATTWVDPFLIEDVASRLKDAPPTLVWYSHTATADALEAAGVKVCRPGTKPDTERAPTHLAVSEKSHSTGLNLQAWSRNIVLCPPSSATRWEQMMGRTHRQGQDRPVEFLVYGHTKYLTDCLTKAKRRARSKQETEYLAQKLCLATWKETT